MHLSPQLLPPPLGDLAAVLKARVFGPRVKPGQDAAASSGITDVTHGGTGANLSATGGANQFVKQVTSGGAFTVNNVVASDLPVFVQAGGGSNARGAVPDPGTTAHANQPYYLGDTAAFVKPKGRLLGALSVSTDESTPSLTYVDLTTFDTLTFSLDVTSDVLVEYTCEFYNTVVANCLMQLMLDGTAQTATAITFNASVANAGFAGHLDWVFTGLASGSHTIKVQKSVSGGTGHWKIRTMRAWLAG